MTSAVDTIITAIMIFVLFERGTRTLVSRRDIGMHTLIVCRCHLVLHGMNAFMHAIDRDGQHDYKEKSGKECQGKRFSHKCCFNNVQLDTNCQESISLTC
jgi:hypothetical protein